MRVWRRRNRTEAKVDCGEYGGGHRRECEEQGLCRARKDGGKNTIRKDVKREVEMVIIVVIVLGSTCCAKDRKRVAAALGRSSEAQDFSRGLIAYIFHLTYSRGSVNFDPP
jgi:hypothetical protein